MEENNIGVALVKEICPACTKEMDGPIVINTKLNRSAAKKVEDMHGKVVGFSDHFCEECTEYTKQGVILITVDPHKTEDRRNPWRTGGFYVLKDNAIERIFPPKQAEALLNKRMGYIEDEVAEAIGLKPKSDDTGSSKEV